MSNNTIPDSRLLVNSEEFRAERLKGNTYNKDKPYNDKHKNALSDGDEWGKGRVGDQVGSKTDIATRNENLRLNNKLYQLDEDKRYGINNM